MSDETTPADADELRAQFAAPAPIPVSSPATPVAAGTTPYSADELRAQFSAGPQPVSAPAPMAPAAVITPVAPEVLADMGTISGEAKAMAESGARPNTVDADALLRQIQMLTARMAVLEGERGVPSNPVAGAKQNIIDHVNARAAQYPTHDFSELRNVLTRLPDHEQLTPAHSDLVRTLIGEVVAAGKHYELAYLPELATVFHKAVLKVATNAVAAGI